MIWKTPTGNFAAHNPPLWLKQDMQQAEAQLPGMQVFTAFLSDLPGWDELKRHHDFRHSHFPDEESYQLALAQLTPGAQFSIYPQRRKKLAGLCNRAFGPSEAFAVIAHDVGSKAQVGTMSDVPMNVQLRLQPVLESDEQWQEYKELPSQAVILLDDRNITARQRLAQELGVDAWMCDVPAEANLHRTQFWHEVHHLRCQLAGKDWAPRRHEERGCDQHAIAMTTGSGDRPTADFQQAIRTLLGFTGPLGTAPYWYPLSLQRADVNEVDELQGLLAVKAAAVGMQGKSAQLVLPLYEKEAAIGSSNLLRQLQANRNSISHPTGQVIADHVLEAAQRYTPGALSRGMRFA